MYMEPVTLYKITNFFSFTGTFTLTLYSLWFTIQVKPMPLFVVISSTFLRNVVSTYLIPWNILVKPTLRT